MQWLIANMWMAMAAATVLGLLFGFAFRGILASNRIRRAEVEREIAKTELTQSKAEVEALYAAQRKQREAIDQSPNSIPAADQQEREGRIATLSDELAAARAELEQLKTENTSDTSILETAGAATAGAIVGAALSDDDQKELTELRDRNTWLEERVGALEADLAAAIVPAAAPAEEPSEPDPTPNPADEKAHWQASYLRTRVDALEAKLVAQSAVPVAAPEAEEPVAPDPTPTAPSGSDVDEELAKLRWRNRYLEGRLAYFEQTPEEAEEAVEDTVEATDTVEPDASSDATEEVVSEAEPELAPEPEPDPEPELTPEPVVAAEAAEKPEMETTQAEMHPSEAMLAELDGKQPVQIDKPSDGGNDLTTITGIGPRIAEVLNGLGIWTFAQIAEWLPENETWIENHLSFKGRVSRENWVGQAKELLVTA